MMNVKAIAEAMGVSKDTVKNCIRRLFPNKMIHGKETLLNEAEVACISKELKNNNSFKTHVTDEVISSVENSVTEAELLANIEEAHNAFVNYLQKKLEAEMTERKNLQIRLDCNSIVIHSGIPSNAWKN